MRIGHVGFKAHLHRFGFTDDPFCECGDPEDVEHVMLNCTRYEAERSVVRSICQNKSVPFNLTSLLGNAGAGEVFQCHLIKCVADFLIAINKDNIF